MWRARFCYWVMDFNPDEAIAAGWLRADSFAAKILERLSRFSLRRADAIVALDRFMRDRIVAKNIAPEKVAVIPPWSQDGDVRFDAAGREKFRAAHGLSDKFVVMYSGNHSPVHPLDTVMRAADLVAARSTADGEQGAEASPCSPPIVFAFIGGGSEFARVKQWADGNPRILCLPYQPLDRLSASLSAADAHLVVMGDAMLGLVHPCKIYNIFAVGAPVVYIGPDPSHVTEAMAAIGQCVSPVVRGPVVRGPVVPSDPLVHNPFISVRHGESERLARELLQLSKSASPSRERPGIQAAFSAQHLVPQLVRQITETLKC